MAKRFLAVLIGSLVSSHVPALAMDPACQPLIAAQMGLRTKPFHAFMTTENRYSSPALARAASTIGASGVKKVEEIWNGKDIYVLTDGKWIDMHTDFSPSGADQNDPDAKKAREQEHCVVLPDEVMAGQATTVYQTHNADLGVDAKFWISRLSHLPIQSQTTTDVGAMTSVTIARYTFGNVQTPQNAVSLSDTMKH